MRETAANRRLSDDDAAAAAAAGDDDYGQTQLASSIPGLLSAIATPPPTEKERERGLGQVLEGGEEGERGSPS